MTPSVPARRWQLACDTLREAGLRVEGGIFLVRFGWYGGFARMQEQGYRVDAVSTSGATLFTTWTTSRGRPPIPPGCFRRSDGARPTRRRDCTRPVWRASRCGNTSSAARCRGRRKRSMRSIRWAAASGPACARATTSMFAMPVTASGIFPGKTAGTPPEAVMWAAAKTASTLPPTEALQAARQQRHRRHVLRRHGGMSGRRARQ